MIRAQSPLPPTHKTMLPEYLSIDVVMERIALDNRWTSEQWRPAAVHAVGPGRGSAVAPVCIEDTPQRTRWRFAGREIEVHPSEAEGYFLNVSSEAPIVFVMWRMRDDDAVPPAEPFIVTLSYNEAGRFMDGGERVDPVPMSAEIREWLAAYVAVHYKPEPKKKARRNDPFADGAFRRGS
jgi:hypothetical protein